MNDYDPGNPFKKQALNSEQRPVVFRLAITYSRGLSPEDGQKRLAEIAEFIKREKAGTAGAGEVLIPGVNIAESPWPGWFEGPLRSGIPNMQFDDINFIFFSDFPTKDEAKFYHQWTVGTYFTSQYIMSSEERKNFVSKVSVAVHEYMLGEYADTNVDNC